MTKNGISTTTEPGQEKYSTFIAGAFRGNQYYQYDYRHTDGKLFSCIGDTLQDCRQQRDEWIEKKK